MQNVMRLYKEPIRKHRRGEKMEVQREGSSLCKTSQGVGDLQGTRTSVLLKSPEQFSLKSQPCLEGERGLRAGGRGKS